MNSRLILSTLFCFSILLMLPAFGHSEDSLYTQGVELSRQGRYEEAIVLFDQAIADGIEIEMSFASKGLCYIEMKEYDNAIDVLQDGIALYPQNIQLYSSIGLAYYWEKQFNTALEYWGKCNQYSPNKQCLAQSALVYGYYDQFDIAIPMANEAIALNPEEAICYSIRAAIYRFMGDTGSALTDLDRCIELDPGFQSCISDRLELLND